MYQRKPGVPRPWMHKDPIVTFWSNVDPGPAGACWVWRGARSRKGYGTLWVSGVHAWAHRFSYNLHMGTPAPAHLQVLHRCDNPPCVNPNHLFLGSNSDNIQDKVRKRRAGKKLTFEQAQAIRAAAGSQHQIAARFGINQSVVSLIRRGILWPL